MVNTILIIVACIMMLAILLTFYRFFKGSTECDRLVAFDLMTVSSSSIIGLIAKFSGRIIYLDVAMVYGLLSFLGVVLLHVILRKDCNYGKFNN
ncbi:MAG: hypothetical protein JEY96_11735 [Bacteroidales bacterium]|nr:hypothetical protein [Bacteroidales bacterium]